MGPELWSYPAQLWPHVAESAYRRERLAADLARTRRVTGAQPTSARGWARPARWARARRRATPADVAYGA